MVDENSLPEISVLRSFGAQSGLYRLQRVGDVFFQLCALTRYQVFGHNGKTWMEWDPVIITDIPKFWTTPKEIPLASSDLIVREHGVALKVRPMGPLDRFTLYVWNFDGWEKRGHYGIQEKRRAPMDKKEVGRGTEYRFRYGHFKS